MSMLVARMQKMKADNLSGIEKHNKRIFKNHSNPDIDVEKSHLNVDLIGHQDKYKDVITEIIESQKVSNRATRKDAVLVNEWILTSDQDFFKDKSQNEIDNFFKETLDWFKERYGSQNIAYAQVHFDERTPHMHLGVVPMRDGRLQGKNIFTRQELRFIQEELPKYLQSKSFDIDRGLENSERKHLTVPEFKEAKEAAKELEIQSSKLRSEAMETVSSINKFKEMKNTLEGEIERNKAFLTEFQQRTKKLSAVTKKKADTPTPYAKKTEPLYEPEIHTDLLGKNVKIKKEDYEKMIASQKALFERCEKVTAAFNKLGVRNKETEKANYVISLELERAKKAIPMQTNHFVPVQKFAQVCKQLIKSEEENKKKDQIIEKQRNEISQLKENLLEFKKICISFIKEKSSTALDLVSNLAQKLKIVSEVNASIKADKEQVRKQHQSRRSEWERGM